MTNERGTTQADGEGFVAELDAMIERALAKIGAAQSAGEPGPAITVAALLEIALRNELEASEEAAMWMSSEPDPRVKLALARQCGDEARHYRLIEDRLRAMGRDVSALDPTAGGPSAMYAYLASLKDTVERLAAGPFAREALARVRNEVFIAFCEAQGDRETAALYRDVIQPDEAHHHQLGRQLLARLATTDALRDAARRAAARTLEIADELQETARLKRGIVRAPGC